MEWIPCTERLPEKSGQYLVTRKFNALSSLWARVYILNYSDLMGLKKEKIWWSGNVGKSDFEKFDDVIAWMPLPELYKIEDIVSPQILNEPERQYLSAVIRPFRDRVYFVCKVNAIESYGSQRIDICFDDASIDTKLPIFESGTMYKGMKTGHEYTLEELGL